MKEYNVVTQNNDGEILRTEVLEVNEEDKIILTVGNDDYRPTPDKLKAINNFFVEILKTNAKVITIPYYVKIEVLKLNS